MTAPAPGPPRTDAAVPVEDDPDEELSKYVFRRMRTRTHAVVVVLLVGGGIVLSLAGRFLRLPGAGALGGLVAYVGAFAAMLVSLDLEGRGARRSKPAAEPGDRVAVLWRNRPGSRGWRHAHAGLDDERLLVSSWAPVLWDVLVTLAIGAIAAMPFGLRGLLMIGPAFALAGFLGLPRRRRVAVEMPWEEIEGVEIRGPRFEVRSRLAPPADLFVLEAKYSAREKLTGALVQRLGARVTLVAPPASSAGRRSKSEPPRTAADLERAADRVRSLRDRSD